MNLKDNTPLYYTILFLLLSSFFLFDTIQNAKGDNPVREKYSINFLNVGQGDATLIQSPEGFQILIDSGPSYEKLEKQLDKFLPEYDEKIEVIVLTHPDKDHMEGLLEILKNYKVGLIIDNPMNKDTKLYQDWYRLIDKKKIKRIEGLAGESIELQNKDGDSILSIDIISPLSTNEIQKQQEINDNSIITKVEYRNYSFLLTGDAGVDIERLMLELYQQKAIDIDVLKVGHHGSKNSSSASFIESTSPDYSIISVGQNSYGHPDNQVIENLDSYKILRTDEYGNISFILKDDNFEIECEEATCDDL